MHMHANTHTHVCTHKQPPQTPPPTLTHTHSGSHCRLRPCVLSSIPGGRGWLLEAEGPSLESLVPPSSDHGLNNEAASQMP